MIVEVDLWVVGITAAVLMGACYSYYSESCGFMFSSSGVIGLLSECLFVRKVWWLINFNEKKVTKKQVAVAWFILLISQAPAVTGTNGIEVGCAKQSLLFDMTNMCAEMGLEMLSKKRKQLQQVSKFKNVLF